MKKKKEVPSERKWTIYDIAREAGVSANTVSKVLNNKPGVGADTRERILTIMHRVKYHPHIGARGLRVKQNACIGVAVAAPFNVAPVSQGLLLWLFSELYRIFGSYGEYVCFDLKSFTASSNVDYARGIFEQLYRACLLVGPLASDDTGIARIHRTGLPYVTLGRLESFPECSYATVDYEEGAYLSTRHLIKHGHTRIAMLKAFQGYQPGVERRRGYMRALEEAGIPFDPDLIRAVKFGAHSIATMVQRLVADKSVTALIDCSATEDGVSLREGLRHAGRRPGRDIEVVAWSYDEGAAVLSEASAHVWLPVREAAAKGMEELAAWTYGKRTTPIQILYHPVLAEGKCAREIEKPKRLFEPLE